MPATIPATSTGKVVASTTFTVDLPAGIVAGDLLVVPWVASATGAATTDHATKGWWRLGPRAVNTRSWAVYVRIYNPADTTTVYTLTHGASANAKWAALAVRGHTVTVEADITVSAVWIRGENGGSQGPIVAPSLNAPTPGLGLALTGEASNAVGAYSPTTLNGFTLAAEISESATANVEIEWVTAWQKQHPASGPTGNLEISYGAVASLNGVGLQLFVPAPGPATGSVTALSSASAVVGGRMPGAGVSATASTSNGACAVLSPASGAVSAASEAAASPSAAAPSAGTSPASSGTSGTPLSEYTATGQALIISATSGAAAATLDASGSADATTVVAGVAIGTGVRPSRLRFMITAHRLPAVRERPGGMSALRFRPRPLSPPIWPPSP